MSEDLPVADIQKESLDRGIVGRESGVVGVGAKGDADAPFPAFLEDGDAGVEPHLFRIPPVLTSRMAVLSAMAARVSSTALPYQASSSEKCRPFVLFFLITSRCPTMVCRFVTTICRTSS